MAFNAAWFKAQEEKKKAEELARKLAENPNYKEQVVTTTASDSDNRLLQIS